MAIISQLMEDMLSTAGESERGPVYERMLGLSVEGVTGVVDKGDEEFEGSVVVGDCCYLLRVRSLTGGRRAKVWLRIVSRSGPGKDDEALAMRVAEMALEDPDTWGRVAVDPRDGEMSYVIQTDIDHLEVSIESAVDWLRIHAKECLEMTWTSDAEVDGEKDDDSTMPRLLALLEE